MIASNSSSSPDVRRAPRVVKLKRYRGPSTTTSNTGGPSTTRVSSSISIAAVRLLLSRLPDALGPINAGTIAVGFVTVGAIVAALWAAPAGMYVAAATVAGGMALQTPALIPVAVNGVEPHDRASAMATFTMFMDLSVALTGPVFGLIVGGGGYRLTYLVAAATSVPALAVLHLVLAPRWRKVHAQPAIG